MRETLFNWLDPVLPGARVLDLFAGSGALGLEAVSRGAREALLVERDPVACEALGAVVERLGAGREVRLLRADAVELLRAPVHGRFDVVFLDPPFEADAWTTVVERLPPWLAPDAWLYMETPPERVPATPGWRVHREGASRGTRHALLRRVLAEGGHASGPESETRSGTESSADTLREAPEPTPSTTR